MLYISAVFPVLQILVCQRDGVQGARSALAHQPLEVPLIVVVGVRLLLFLYPI